MVLELTPDGQKRIREAFRSQNERESQWAEGLTDDERETLIHLLEKLMTRRRQIGAAQRH